MKKDIHPEYYKKAKVSCACGATYTMGAARKEIHVEICSNCHPFYTGEKKLIDTAGRVERFKTRRAKAVGGVVKSKRIKKAVKRAKRAERAAKAPPPVPGRAPTRIVIGKKKASPTKKSTKKK